MNNENINNTSGYAEARRGKLVYISVEDIFPHPDNPRKDLGDLTELADSIRENGIMQNLTVVPDDSFDGLYTVVIGHRRLAAAKIAGLLEVPCVIAEMPPKEQLATMLLENMQRSDLTVYEQAQGFQMMFDFGESVESIAKKTGFSQSTVRHRLKMAELDSETLKEVSTRQISLLDFDRLYEIKNEKVRNSVLSEMGTNNFEFKLSQALEAQKQKERHAEIRAVLAKYNAVEIPSKDKWNSKYTMIRSYVSISGDLPDFAELLEGVETVYYCFEASYVSLLKDKAEESEEEDEAVAERKRLEAEKAERINALKEMFGNAYKLRRDFVTHIPHNDAKNQIGDIVAYIFKISCDVYTDFDYEDCAKLLGLEIPEDDDADAIYPMFEDVAEFSPHRALLMYAYSLSGDNSNETCIRWDGKYTENRGLCALYSFLEKFGYEMSDDEAALMNGTHELYIGNEQVQCTDKNLEELSRVLSEE